MPDSVRCTCQYAHNNEEEWVDIEDPNCSYHNSDEYISQFEKEAPY